MNENVLASLPTAQKLGGLPAYLDVGGDRLSFLYNPESIEQGRTANYAEAGIIGAGDPEQQYLNSSARRLSLPNLLLDSFSAGRSLTQLLEGLEKLLMPKEKGRSPAIVYFSWGSKRFGPAVTTSMDWTETAWLSGEPAIARVSLALIGTGIPPKAAKPPTPTGKTSLTSRQQGDAIAQATGHLRANLVKLSPQIASAFSSGRYKLLSNDQGLVAIADKAGRAIADVGRWDGYGFDGIV